MCSSDLTTVFDVEATADIAIVSLSDVKTQLGKRDTTNDDELRSYLLSASENIEAMCGPCAVRAFTERVTGRGRTAVWLSNTPVVSLTSLAPVYTWVTPLAVDDVTLDPDTGKITRVNRWCPFFGDYDVAYTAGRAVVPASMRLACMIIVQHLWDTRRGNIGSRGPAADETVTLPGWGYAIPNRAAELIGGNRRTMFVA